ncbi:MAG TPA: DegV family protein [Halanaerobiales bacterium]|nr:DegV family protein [Halanaerobiales bacterium]
MAIQILADSCCDLNEKIKEKYNIQIVPLKIFVNDKEFVDDENLNKEELIDSMRNDNDSPKTASPSPQLFIEKYKEAEESFVVTLSSKLSGTYQNANLAKSMIMEELNDKFIHVFDSLSASAGETIISIKIGELVEKGLEKNNIIEKVDNYINEMKTMFVLDSLDNLIKAGRMSKVKGKLASFFNIKPILGSDGKGEIQLLDKARGSKRVFKKLVQLIGEKGENLEEKIIGIAHCNALDKAENLKKQIEKKYNFKDIVIVETAGISTVYANEGGIVIAF